MLVSEVDLGFGLSLTEVGAFRAEQGSLHHARLQVSSGHFCRGDH